MSRKSRMALVVSALVFAGCVSADPATVNSASPAPEESIASGATAFVTGSVVDTEVVPIANATVATDPPSLLMETKTDGSFELGPLPAGPITIIAEKQGYESARMELTLTDGEKRKVSLVIKPMAADVPFTETLPFKGYLVCHVVAVLPSPLSGGLNAPCAAATDTVFGPGTLPDRWIFPFKIEKRGFTTLLLEMTWQPQQFGKDGLMQLSTLGNAQASGTGVTIAGTVYGDTQASPFRAALTAGRSYWNSSSGPVVFYPSPNATESFKLMFAGGEGNNTLPRAAVFVDFRSDIYVTFFYNRPMPRDYTFLKPT
ncbi:MAG TPA: carboxypeptidase-like regulatory domain-containing protein [Candidatus Thermoplasmatota archaeon]|nr:carboxypeptidase-like regulatory domain-containing protein [Candidatus Thermoplasmatota archaeon]